MTSSRHHLRDILDRLAVTHDCCRKTLVTSMIFQDFY